jgi:3-deoxy-D-manno-octulosonic-acid transferase
MTFPFYWIAIRFRNKNQKSVFYERFGHPTEDRPKGDLVWVHCDNLAESVGIVKNIANNMQNKIILLTYNSKPPEGKIYYGGSVICQYAPVDAYLAVRRFLNFWEPSFAIRIGSELKPNQLARLKKMNVPSFLINGQLSNKSYRRWKLIKRFAKKVVRNFTFIWAMDNLQTLRFANLGAHDIKSMELVIGTNKMKEILYNIRRINGR